MWCVLVRQCNILQWICSADLFQLRWFRRYISNSTYYHNQIGSINLYYCSIFFSWFLFWCDCAIIYCQLFYFDPAKADFPLLLCSLRCLQIIWYIWSECHIRLFAHYISHYHHYADVPERIEYTKRLSDIVLSSICLGLSSFSQIFFMQYMGLCAFIPPISPLIIVSIHLLYLIIIIK